MQWSIQEENFNNILAFSSNLHKQLEQIFGWIQILF